MANTIALVVLLATFAVCLAALVLVFILEPRKRTARLTDAEKYEWARIWARYDCEAPEPAPRKPGEEAA